MVFSNLDELLESLHDTESSERRETARSALASEVGRWMPQLLQTIQNEDPETRYLALAALGELGHAAQEGTPTVVGLLGDEDEWVRYYACCALGEIGSSEPALAESLSAMTADCSWHVRQAAIDAVAKLGCVDDNVVRTLVQALDDNDFRVRCSAVDAIGTLRIWKCEMLAPFERILANPDEWGQRHAIQALSEVDAPTDWVVVHATRLLDHVDPVVRTAAAETLSQCGAAATHAIAPLLESLSTSALPDHTRDAMRAVLRAIGKESIQCLLTALDDGRPMVRAEAARVLGDLEGPASSTLAALRPAMRDNDELVRTCAAGAVWRLTGDATDLLEVLVNGLKSEDCSVAVSAAMTLGRMGVKGVEAIEALNDLAIGGSGDARRAATVALIRLTRRDETNVTLVSKLLITLLEGEDYELRQIAARGLGILGHATSEVVPILQRCANSDWDLDVQAAAARSLKRLSR